MAVKSKKQRQDEIQQVREMAGDDLFTFARLVNPQYLYGEIHKEVFFALQNDDADVLILLPRDHLKSHCMAVWCAWKVCTKPTTTILYVTATSELAESQVYAIQNMLLSDVVRRYWPDLIHEQASKREKWNASGFIVDHPERKAANIRDFTVRAVGLGTRNTGKHCDYLVFDDLVIPENAYTETGREEVARGYAQLNSICTMDGVTKAVGTRYHPSDLYNTMSEEFLEVFDEEGEVIGREDTWKIIEKVVETDGVFLWPKVFSPDGKLVKGFDFNVLAKKRAKYSADMTQFYAQYYMNPNDIESNRLSPDKFRRYNQRMIKRKDGQWYYGSRKLNVYAAMDFAYSMGKRSDYTAIVVIGIDSDGYIFVLDIDRFKTDKYKEYSDHAKELYDKWKYRKIRVEVKGAQKPIVNFMKDEFRAAGYIVSFDEYCPTSHSGSKEERIGTTLEPLYENETILHFEGGWINALEEELVLARPPHDDIKDALAMAVQIAVKPARQREAERRDNVVQFNRRFGGVAFR
jgi:phage terminase large subunit-like protein